MLRNMMSLAITETKINEFNRFDDLVNTVDKAKAKESLEKIYNKELKPWEVSIEVIEILRNFILSGGFDINSLINEKR